MMIFSHNKEKNRKKKVKNLKLERSKYQNKKYNIYWNVWMNKKKEEMKIYERLRKSLNVGRKRLEIYYKSIFIKKKKKTII